MASNDNKIPFKVGPFRLAHPHVNRPDDKFEKDKPKFTADGVDDPNSPAMKNAREQVAAAAKALGLKKGQGTPISAHSEKNEDDIKVATGKYVFKAKTQYAPALKDAKGKDLDREKFRVGGGSLCVLYGYFEPYTMGTGGMSARLQVCQVLELVAPKSGSGGGESSGGFEVDAYDGYEGIAADEPAVSEGPSDDSEDFGDGLDL